MLQCLPTLSCISSINHCRFHLIIHFVVPVAPVDLTIRANGSKALSVRWKKPRPSYGKIIEYQVQKSEYQR